MVLFCLVFFFHVTTEWDAEWPGPQVIVEVSEKASSANETNIEGNAHYSVQFEMFNATSYFWQTF